MKKILPADIEAFPQVFFNTAPSARQTRMSGASPGAFEKVLFKKGQRLQLPFKTAVKAKDGGFLQPSIDALTEYLSKAEKLHGSLFGKQADYTYGIDENFSIDKLITVLKTHAEVTVHE